MALADALKQEHENLATTTKTALAQATARAAETAATAAEPLQVNSTAHLKDLTAAAARVFGWDSKQPQVQLNQLVITSEQLDQIRALRQAALKESDNGNLRSESRSQVDKEGHASVTEDGRR